MAGKPRETIGANNPQRVASRQYGAEVCVGHKGPVNAVKSWVYIVGAA